MKLLRQARSKASKHIVTVLLQRIRQLLLRKERSKAREKLQRNTIRTVVNIASSSVSCLSPISLSLLALPIPMPPLPPLPPLPPPPSRRTTFMGLLRTLTLSEWLGWSIVLGGMSYTAALESRRLAKAKDKVTFCEPQPYRQQHNKKPAPSNSSYYFGRK